MSGRCRCCGMPGVAGLVLLVVGGAAMGIAVLAATGAINLENDPGKALQFVLQEGWVCCMVLPWSLYMALTHLGWLEWDEEGVGRRTALGAGRMAWRDLSGVQVSAGHFGWPSWTLSSAAGRSLVLPFDAVGARGTPLFDELERRVGQLRRAARATYAVQGGMLIVRRSKLGLVQWLLWGSLLAGLLAAALAFSGEARYLVNPPTSPTLATSLTTIVAVGALVVVVFLVSFSVCTTARVTLASTGVTSLVLRRSVAMPWSDVMQVHITQSEQRDGWVEVTSVRAGEQTISLPATCANYLAARDFIVSQVPAARVTWDDNAKTKPLWQRLRPALGE